MTELASSKDYHEKTRNATFTTMVGTPYTAEALPTESGGSAFGNISSQATKASQPNKMAQRRLEPDATEDPEGWLNHMITVENGSRLGALDASILSIRLSKYSKSFDVGVCGRMIEMAKQLKKPIGQLAIWHQHSCQEDSTAILPNDTRPTTSNSPDFETPISMGGSGSSVNLVETEQLETYDATMADIIAKRRRTLLDLLQEMREAGLQFGERNRN